MPLVRLMGRADEDASVGTRDLSPPRLTPPQKKRSKLVHNADSKAPKAMPEWDGMCARCGMCGTCEMQRCSIFNVWNADSNTLRATPEWDVAFFDLDDCLYKNNWATEKKITEKIDKYLVSVLKLEPGSSNRLYRTYGTTIAGLIEEKHISVVEVQAFLDYAHDISLEDIKPDPQLPEMLKRIKCKRWVFSNSTRDHVERCLKILGISDLFEGVIAASSVDMFSRCGYVTKPNPKCFQAAMDIAGVSDPKACIFMDDSVRNIKTAKELGWHGVLVGLTGRNGENLECPEADAAIARVTDLLEAVPELCAPDV